MSKIETIEYRDLIDKDGWGDGEWMNEPDKIQWADEATGLPCLIVRNGMGALCGYVGVGKDHPCYEKNYHSVDVDVHGGLTYSNHCYGGEHGICHVHADGEDDSTWWLGFDTIHLYDYAPGMVHTRDRSESYKNLAYVKAEIANLANQLHARRVN